ncbi:MAG: ATP-binding protein [Bacteroidetes bacterium]|nr:ATP-binding protein [Bacteroidota bacterium]
MEKLTGREKEKKTLEAAFASNRAELIAVYGRRRIGKTFLIRSVFEKSIVFEFTGAYNTKMPIQLGNFAKGLQKAMGSPAALAVPKTWSDAMSDLEKFLQPIVTKKRAVVFFDEFPWINSQKSNFLQAFDHFWNSWASKYPNLTVVICGSAASWMIQHIVHSKGGLHNRVTERMGLAPFSLNETELYLLSRSVKLDRYQLLQLYMVMGGVPHYLAGIQTGESSVQAIDRICFSPNGALTKEFDDLYASLFDQSTNHVAVVKLLSSSLKGLSRKEIISGSGMQSGGWMSKVLKELEESGFITSYIPFGKVTRDLIYRLTDEYSLFYLRFIDGKRSKGKGTWLSLYQKPTWNTWSGFAFEAVCLKHKEQIREALGLCSISVDESIWRHVPGKGKPGAQIDLLLDRSDHCMNLCEMKFSTTIYTITKKYSQELEQKKTVFTNPYSTKLIDKELTMDDLFAI